MAQASSEYNMAEDKVTLHVNDAIPQSAKSQFGFSNFFQPCMAELLGLLLFVFIGCLAVQDSPLGVGTGSPAAIAVAVAHGFTIALLIAGFGHMRPSLVELVGVFLFVFIGTLSYSSLSVVAIAFAHGLIFALLIAGFGHISGGHFNPAVTLGVLIAGEITPLLALGYLVSQCVGAVIGAACCRGVLSFVPEGASMTPYEAILGGAHDLAPGVDPGRGILCEMLLTTVLITTVLMTAVDSKGKNSLAPLAIGFAVTVCILAGINVTGASMNPARSFGPAVVISYYKPAIWNHHYVYWVGPLLGSGFAGLMYRFVFASADKRLILKED
ncbi:unnamed protein product [Owenia fusiformis]|uniref:Uncharacterized protein n=1 Tax=Owenia fusiformis TaxID=6347 RepID=A0A8J1U992_OWEFU|nr:unnamed protein product [Owenia fusiformis]